jgi:hypothetical protein
LEQALKEKRLNALVNQIELSQNKNIPEIGREQIQVALLKNLSRCENYSFVNDSEICIFMQLCLYFGNNFDSVHSKAGELLGSRFISQKVKIENMKMWLENLLLPE